MTSYRIHGICLASDYPFPLLTPGEVGPSTVRFRLRSTRPRRPPAAAADLGAHPGPEGQGKIQFYRDGLSVWFQSPTVGQFWVSPDSEGIVCHVRQDFNADHLRHQAVRVALSLALHQRGVLNLHASGVRLGDTGRAVALMGFSGQGKSTLTAALVRRGHALVGDDLLAVEQTGAGVDVHPGTGYIRLCPDTCRWMGLDSGPEAADAKIPWTAAKLGGTAVPAPLPLSFVALLARNPGAKGADLERLPPCEALFALMAHTSCRYFLPAALQQRLLIRYTRLKDTLPVYRLTYPDGAEGLALAEVALVQELRGHSVSETAKGKP